MRLKPARGIAQDEGGIGRLDAGGPRRSVDGWAMPAETQPCGTGPRDRDEQEDEGESDEKHRAVPSMHEAWGERHGADGDPPAMNIAFRAGEPDCSFPCPEQTLDKAGIILDEPSPGNILTHGENSTTRPYASTTGHCSSPRAKT